MNTGHLCRAPGEARSPGLDDAEERLSRHAVRYQRSRETDADRIVMRDPDGLSIILFHAGEPSATGMPPASLYWYR